MGKYAASVGDATTSTTIGAMIAFTTVADQQAEFVEMSMTGSGITAAADTQHSATWDFTDGGTPATDTAQTPIAFNQLSNVSKFTSVVCNVAPITAEPATIIAPPPVRYGFNQRGGMRWAVPRGEGVFLDNAHANEDGAFRVDSVAAGKIDTHVHWWEP